MGRSRHLVAVVAAGLLLTSCANGSGPEPALPEETRSAGARPTANQPQADPVGLIGSWTVTEVAGAAGGILRIAPADQGGLSWFGPCGVSTGMWRAGADGLFVADLSGHLVPDGPECRPGPGSTPAWLRQTTAFRLEKDIPVLLDEQGRQIARLLPGAKPAPGPNLLPSLAEPPVITPEVRQAFAPAAVLPAHLTPVSRDDLRGRWVPAGRDSGRAHVELRDDGEWRGSDGCNGQSGRWVAGAEGALLATAGPSTLIGCDNVPLASWLAKATRAGMDGELLVLLDADGKESGRLARG
ncbi:hypothetical protein ABZ814_07620 [Micromonospora musae]|uniref:META domain-containing protein n=1 Tax=Micromonospora musae TaxID=1894970 RepID=UPI0033C95D3B